MTSKTLVLASQSPRRSELLTMMDVDFDAIPSNVDESKLGADHPRTFAIRAAYAKANDVAQRVEADRWILGSDTVVTKNMKLYGKPVTADDARQMLRELSGERHQVITGIALLLSGSNRSYLHAVSTLVTFRTLSDVEINDYIATGEPMDKAGAYGIQGKGGDLIERIDGDYFNVVGLPCMTLADFLTEAGYEGSFNVPATPDRWL